MNHKILPKAAAILSLVGISTTASAQPYFEFIEIADALSPQIGTGTFVPSFTTLGSNGMASGVAAADYDNDGDIDIFVPNGDGLSHPDFLFRNNLYNAFGETTPFTEVAASDPNGDYSALRGILTDGVGQPHKPRSRSAIWIDFNADGLLDLFVAGDAMGDNMNTSPYTAPRLYQQQISGEFVDVSTITGLSTQTMIEDQNYGPTDTILRHLGGVTSGDLNGDGYPEIFVGLWQTLGANSPTDIGYRLFVNIPKSGSTTGEREYVNATSATLFPLNNTTIDRYGAHWQPVIHDFNGDGWLDIFCAVDGNDNHLWLNDGQPVQSWNMTAFTDAGISAGLEAQTWGGTDMGVAIADVNVDHVQDVYTTNIDHDGFLPDWHNALFLSSDTDIITYPYVESSGSTITKSDGAFSWGCTFGDFDRDGFIDLAVTNGDLGNCSAISTRHKSNLFLNDGNTTATFTDVGTNVGFDDEDFGSSLISADFDRDGDLDLVQVVFTDSACSNLAEVRFLENSDLCSQGCPANLWINIRPRLDTPNRFATGSLVRVITGSGSQKVEQTRVITTGISIMGQEPAEAHFGLGDELATNTPVSVIVEWPNNRLPATLEGTALSLTNQVQDIAPCEIVDLVAPFGVMNSDDALKFMEFYAAGDMRADLDADGQLTFFDWAIANSIILAGCL